MMEAIKDEWRKRASTLLVGRTIREVRYLTDAETEANDWHASPLLIIFDDGSWIYPMSDDEGNMAGALATSDDNEQIIPVV